MECFSTVYLGLQILVVFLDAPFFTAMVLLFWFFFGGGGGNPCRYHYRASDHGTTGERLEEANIRETHVIF